MGSASLWNGHFRLKYIRNEHNVRVVFVLAFNSTSHLGIDSLGLNSTKETGADDELLEIANGPPPTDPAFNLQWALQELDNNADINVKEGWNEYLTETKGKHPNGSSVIVAVIDTGVDYTHPELRNMMWINPKEIAGNGKDDEGKVLSVSGDPIFPQIWVSLSV